MTVFEKIKSMSKEELTELLIKLETNREIFSYVYCTQICKDRLPDYGCIHPENAELPCMDMTEKDNVIAWLDSDYKE